MFFDFMLKIITSFGLFNYNIDIVPNDCPHVREAIFTVIIIPIGDKEFEITCESRSPIVMDFF